MTLLDSLKQNSTVTNTKGSKYYNTSYNCNLDVFTLLTRYSNEEKIRILFENALEEDKDLALANLLYLLDIRNGKGERRIFKIIFEDLCFHHKDEALKILPFIKKLGRFDYILIGIDTPIEKETISYIKKQLEEDIKSDAPSLLAKWMPSHRTHGQNNKLAKKLMTLLGMKEKEYRKTLSTLRKKINITEKNLTEKKYEKIDFSKVPAKAMLKYQNAFDKNMKEKFNEYKDLVKKGKTKINTKGLFSYEIIKKILLKESDDTTIYDLMWDNQKDILNGDKTNLLVVADTSGSMTNYGYIPYCTSVGLAMYIAERNHGIFHSHFITFSEEPVLREIKGKTLTEKVRNIETINAWNTDIDKVFDLLLKTAKENNLSDKDMPSHIIIISDMEFDDGINSKGGTNFQTWKSSFEEEKYKLPNIIFWNAAGNARGIPVTKFDKDVAMVSGFSTNILENLLTLDKYTPIDLLLEKLSPYLEMLKSI
ncbi:MAG: DUF2828 family protein [Bacilli bacterium]|nr:DUF2828 family protein [Bacilli bacterium]